MGLEVPLGAGWDLPDNYEPGLSCSLLRTGPGLFSALSAARKFAEATVRRGLKNWKSERPAKSVGDAVGKRASWRIDLVVSWSRSGAPANVGEMLPELRSLF